MFFLLFLALTEWSGQAHLKVTFKQSRKEVREEAVHVSRELCSKQKGQPCSRSMPVV